MLQSTLSPVASNKIRGKVRNCAFFSTVDLSHLMVHNTHIFPCNDLQPFREVSIQAFMNFMHVYTGKVNILLLFLVMFDIFVLQKYLDHEGLHFCAELC